MAVIAVAAGAAQSGFAQGSAAAAATAAGAGVGPFNMFFENAHPLMISRHAEPIATDIIRCWAN
jgi:hypothetical protein